MAFKKSNKNSQPTPTDTPVEPLSIEERRKNMVFDHYSARRDSKDIATAVRRKRKTAIILTIAVIIMLVLWLISWLLTSIGDLVIDVDSSAAVKGLVISESPEVKDPVLELSGKNVKDVTAITYNWLPTNLDEEADGTHNGKNYLAYTFYLKNTGSSPTPYDSTLSFAGVAKSADESLRVMIYKNGEPTIYAKHNMDDSPLEEIVNFEFVDEKTIMNEKTESLAAGDVVKYTIVTWIEGNDPEAIDDIKGAYAKMKWSFEVKE